MTTVTEDDNDNGVGAASMVAGAMTVQRVAGVRAKGQGVKMNSEVFCFLFLFVFVFWRLVGIWVLRFRGDF